MAVLLWFTAHLLQELHRAQRLPHQAARCAKPALNSVASAAEPDYLSVVTVATRNAAVFDGAGAGIMNPFGSSAPQR
jgi:hypothetical protein